MDKICAFVDFQGFQLKNDKFIPREMAIASDFLSQCIEINPGIDIHQLSKEEQNIVKYITRHKTGLHLRPFNDTNYCFVPAPDQIGDVLRIWYEMISSDEKPYFAFKNRQMGKILRENEIPCLDLDEQSLDFPPYRDIKLKYSQNYLCGYHKQNAYGSPLKFNCSYRKCAQMFREIKSRAQAMKTKTMDWNEENSI